MARLHCGKTTTNYRSGAGQEQCGGAAHEPARSVRRDIAPDDRQVAELALLHGSRRQGEPHLELAPVSLDTILSNETEKE